MNGAADIYEGLRRIGRVERRGRQFLGFAWDEGEGALRPLGAFSSAKAAKDAILQREARHAA